jgi:hypothetical protein
VRDLKIGVNGRAYIIDKEGTVVALSKSENQMTTNDEGETVPRTFEQLAEIDEAIKLAIDNNLLAGDEAVTFSAKADSGTDLTISKSPVTGISVDWNIIIISVDADNLVESRSLFEVLSILHYVILVVLSLSIFWELYSFYKKFKEDKLALPAGKSGNSQGEMIKDSQPV